MAIQYRIGKIKPYERKVCSCQEQRWNINQEDTKYTEGLKKRLNDHFCREVKKSPNKPINWKFVMFFLRSGSNALCFSSLVYLRLTLESSFLPIQKVLRDHYPVIKWPECEDWHSSIQFVCKYGFTFTHTTCLFDSWIDQEITPVITHHHDIDWCLLQQYQHQHLVLATRIHCQKQPVPTGMGKKRKTIMNQSRRLLHLNSHSSTPYLLITEMHVLFA